MTAFAEFGSTFKSYELRIPSRRFPIVRTHDGVNYEVHKVTRANQWDLRHRVLPFEKDFGYSNSFVTHEKVVHYVKVGTEVVFAKLPDSNSDIAVVTEELKKANIGGEQTRVLSIGIRVVSEEVQQKHIGGNLLNEAITRLYPDAITGLSRTWRIFRMLEASPLIDGIVPIDKPFTPFFEEMLNKVLDRGTVGRTNLMTGLCLGILPEVSLKHLTPPTDNVKGVEMYNKMWSGPRAGARPELGDAIRYIALVNKEAVDDLIRTGWEDSKGITAVRRIPPFVQKIFDVFGMGGRLSQ